MTKANDLVREEGVITIRDDRQNLVGIAYKDTGNGGEVVMYRVEKISYGDMKDFLAELAGQRRGIIKGDNIENNG